MNTLSYKTVSMNKATVNKEWLVIDATNQTLGRFCSKVALVLRGKHKPSFTPNADCGDNVIIINADKIRLTGNKWANKEYIRHTGYPGGQRIVTAEQMLAKKPIAIIEKGIKGMLPKNRLASSVYRNLHVYAGAQHPHEAQEPKEFDINTIK
ncbi:MAG TPA: 50S ribosomal protein L13 [Bacteroidales bacterium]|nr:50S ribosomal protein L13 [Bacteroidales bacterium]